MSHRNYLPRFLLWLFSLLVLFLLLPSARAQSPGQLDPTFNLGSGANDDVVSLAVQPDGKILLGGWFASYNGTTLNHIARLHSDGSRDASFDLGSGIGGRYPYVGSIVVQMDGGILIGGEFSTFNGTARNRIARIKSNGSLDTTFNPGSGPNPGSEFGAVYAIALQPDGKVLLGGYFAYYNSTRRDRIARLNSNGSLDTTFNPGSGVRVIDPQVHSVVLQADEKALIAGQFTSYNGTERNGIARINSNGSLDTTLNPGSGVETTVPPVGISSLAVQADGKVLIGGWFKKFNNTARNGLARLNSNGSLDATFNPSINVGSINSIVVQTDGKILIGGYLDDANRNGIVARLNSDGSLDATFNPGLGANDIINSLVVQADGNILLGGSFTSYNGTACGRLVRLLNDPATQSLAATSAARVQWLRGGSAPEVERVVFERSADGVAWSALGNGTRITGGWELSGLSLPVSGHLRARGRVPGGGASSSVIEQKVTYNLAASPFETAVTAAGLTGPHASAGAEPFGDGVANLLKFAFNLNLAGPDASPLKPGSGNAGLPFFGVETTAGGPVFRVEYLRRANARLTYTPKVSPDLSPGSFASLTGPESVTPLPDGWERVRVEQPVNLADTPRLFGVVEVVLTEP